MIEREPMRERDEMSFYKSPLGGEPPDIPNYHMFLNRFIDNFSLKKMKYVTISSWAGIRLVEAKRYWGVHNGPVPTGGTLHKSFLHWVQLYLYVVFYG